MRHKFFSFLNNEKVDVVIDSSGASTVSILETILSPEGKKELSDMAEFAKQHNLRPSGKGSPTSPKPPIKPPTPWRTAAVAMGMSTATGTSSKKSQLYPKTISNETAMFEFKTTQDFLDRLASVSSDAGMSKPEAIFAGIDLLEKLVEADRRGMELSFVPKSSEQDV